MYAYVGDLLHYYIDRMANEAFIQTATQPSSVINLAAMLDYFPTLANSATTDLTLTFSSTTSTTIPAGSQFSTQGSSTQAPIVFQTTSDVIVSSSSSPTSLTVTVSQSTTYTNVPTGSGYWTLFKIPYTATQLPGGPLATSTGAVNQAYSLFYSPVAADSFDVYLDLGTGLSAWTYVTNLIDYGPYDQVFTNFVDANNTMWIIFGDGVNGYVPPLGTPIYCTYSTTEGFLGNVGSGLINVPVNAIVGLTGVTNADAATGGADPESLNSIRTNAPAALKTLNRAVTVSDFATLAIQQPGVQWAAAVESTYQLVNLYICPYGGGIPSSDLQSKVQTYINGLSMANTTVTIYPPTYVPVDVSLSVVIYDSYSASAVEQEIISVLNNLFSLSHTGFGFRVSQGLVYQAVLAVPGVNYAILYNLNREVWATLTSPIVGNTSTPATVTYLSVSPLPQTINSGDTIIVSNGGATATFTAQNQTGAGATTIIVSQQSVSVNFPVGSTVQDTGAPSQYSPSTSVYTNDVVTFDYEIPVIGTNISVNVSGGLP
jgi:uncharacterized phage protein gp47/JayE